MSTPSPHKVIIVTGGASGVGLAITRAFLDAGNAVVVCDVSSTVHAVVETELVPTHPGRTLAVQCNVCDDAALDRLFAEAEKTFGRIDGVVNNAGVMDDYKAAGEIERALWDKVVAVNLTAPAMVTQRAVNSFIRNGVKGTIVNISSIAALRGWMSGVAYTTTKHGLLGLTKNTAAYYASKGIRCNAILPGAMPTNIFDPRKEGMNTEGLTLMAKHYPQDAMPLLEIAKVARLVVYLSSDEADIVNGATWTVDGGVTAF